MVIQAWNSLTNYSWSPPFPWQPIIKYLTSLGFFILLLVFHSRLFLSPSLCFHADLELNQRHKHPIFKTSRNGAFFLISHCIRYQDFRSYHFASFLDFVLNSHFYRLVFFFCFTFLFLELEMLAFRSFLLNYLGFAYLARNYW